MTGGWEVRGGWRGVKGGCEGRGGRGLKEREGGS